MRSLLRTSILFAILCFLGFVSMIFSAISLIGSLLVGPSPEALFQTCCGSALARLSVGWLLFAAIAVAAGFVLVRTARSLWRLRDVSRRVEGLRRVSTPERIMGVDCRIFEDSSPLAFCTGMLRPEVYVSRSAIDDMPPETLRVVLAHEDHHRTNRDPLRRALASALAEGFFFLPILGQLGQKHIALSEIRADQAAVGSSLDGRRKVADAMLSFPTAHPDTVGEEITADRVDNLTGLTSIWAPNGWTLTVTFIALAALLSAPVMSVELLTNVPVGFQALGLHVCLLVLTSIPLFLAGASAWTRPSFRLS